MSDGGPWASMQLVLRRQPLRVMDASEIYELASAAMKDKGLHHPGFCRRPRGMRELLLDDDSHAEAPEAKPPEHERCPAAGRFSRCNLRCDMGYWHAHGNVVGQLMARLARRLGKDPNLYMATGVLHALDVLSHPHDKGGAPGELVDPEGHPLPLLKRLSDLGAPRSMLLAILEYMPATGLTPSGPLSHALRVCDALATCFECGADFELPDDARELDFLLEARDELRFPRHAEHALVAAAHVGEVLASCRALAGGIAEKDVLRERREAAREAAQDVRAALGRGEGVRRRPGEAREREDEARTSATRGVAARGGPMGGVVGGRAKRPVRREREMEAE